MTSIHTSDRYKVAQTDVSFDVLVLKVEGMLPDIDTDDGNASEYWILVRSGDNFKHLGHRVENLKIYERSSRR